MQDTHIMQYVRNVENVRKRLIHSLKDLNESLILDTASLDVVATEVNSALQKRIETPGLSDLNLCEIRFFDVDGTQIGESQWVKPGEYAVPPENPNYDPERLVFKRWCSALGADVFGPIMHDVDYGAQYETIDYTSYLFLTLDETTTTTVTTTLYQYYTNSISSLGFTPTVNIDWGDGTPPEQCTAKNTTATFTHTYEQPGNYIITYTPNYTNNQAGTMYYYIQSPWLSAYPTSTADIPILRALTKIYCPIMHGWTSSYEYCNHMTNLEVVVIGYSIICRSSSGWNFPTVPCVIIPATAFTVSNYSYIHCSRTRVLIINKGCKFENFIISGMTYSPLDKIIMPYGFSKVKDPTSAIDTLGIYEGYGQLKKIIMLESVAVEAQNSSSYPATRVPLSLEYYTPADEPVYWQNYSLASAEQIYRFKFPSGGFTFSSSDVKLPKGYTYIDLSYITNTKIDLAKVVSNNYYIEYIIFPKDYANAIDLSKQYKLTLPCCLELLANLKDLTGSTAKTLVFNRLFLSKLFTVYVYKNNDIWEVCDKNTEGAILILDAFREKNWTISYTGLSN